MGVHSFLPPRGFYAGLPQIIRLGDRHVSSQSHLAQLLLVCFVFKDYFFYLYALGCICIRVKAREVVDVPGVGVTGDCELLHLGAGD